VPFRVFEPGRGSHRDDRFCERNVGGEEHAAAVARRHLDGADAPVRDGAAQERDLSQARHLQVGEIGAAAIEQAPVFVSPDRGPNTLRGVPLCRVADRFLGPRFAHVVSIPRLSLAWTLE
jgi:hypothetical protein